MLRSLSSVSPGAPLLEHILLSSQAAGIEKFVIVVGYRADAIRRWLAGWRHDGITVTLVENPDYHKANGISVLAARCLFQGPFLLLMADHIFEPKTAKALTPTIPRRRRGHSWSGYKSIAFLTWRTRPRSRLRK